MISVPIRYRRAERGLFLQKLQHALPSIVVLGDGLAHLSHNPHGVELLLGGFEVAAALAVMASVVHGFRKLRASTADDEHAHHHHGVDWIDIFIGAMLSVEAYAKYHASGHIPRPTILMAVTMLVLGMAHGRIAAAGQRRRALRVTEDGISVSLRPFSRLSLAWSEVASIEVDQRWAVITATDGRSKRIDLSAVRQPQAIRDALTQARARLDAARHAASASIESTAADA
jgi:hypothetical protein